MLLSLFLNTALDVAEWEIADQIRQNETSNYLKEVLNSDANQLNSYLGMRERKLFFGSCEEEIMLKDVQIQGVLQLFNDRLKKYYYVKSTHLFHALENEISGNGNQDVYADMLANHYFYFRFYIVDSSKTDKVDTEIDKIYNSLIEDHNAYITSYLRKPGVKRIQDIDIAKSILNGKEV